MTFLQTNLHQVVKPKSPLTLQSRVYRIIIDKYDVFKTIQSLKNTKATSLYLILASRCGFSPKTQFLISYFDPLGSSYYLLTNII